MRSLVVLHRTTNQSGSRLWSQCFLLWPIGVCARPTMVLVDPQTIATLGRIPKYDEVWCWTLNAGLLIECCAKGHAVTLAQAAEVAAKDGLRFFIEMFSHHWCKKDQPDDDASSKAKALVEWASYRTACGLRTFFWIDYSCVDQNCIAPGVTMLPLYVATCNNIVTAHCWTERSSWSSCWCRSATIHLDMKSGAGVGSKGSCLQ